MEIVLHGVMGRDDALADRLVQEGHKIHAIGQWENPGLVEKAESSGGQFHLIGSMVAVKTVARITKDIGPDMFLSNSDDALAAGVVDAVRETSDSSLLIPSPDRAAARIEWDKFFLREIVNEIDPAYNPLGFMASTPHDVDAALDSFASQDVEVVIKPPYLTGGKGVWVQGKHFDNFSEARAYAMDVLAHPKQGGVEIQEKLAYPEFNLQLFTDGKTVIRPPVAYDYPYREDGDTGPGTGGMGVFTVPDTELLPFITEEDYSDAVNISEQILANMRERGLGYKGLLYPSFFKTPDGLKIIETNARGGDPELINMVDLLESDVDAGSALRQIALGELTPDAIRYQKLASTVIYLVPPDHAYPGRNSAPVDFNLDQAAVCADDCKVRFAAARHIRSHNYHSVGASRTVSLSALGATPWEARDKIHRAIAEGFGAPLPLDYRRDVGDRAYIQGVGQAV